jgi:hypothetical protein
MNTVNAKGYSILEMDVFVSTSSNDGGNDTDDENASILRLFVSTTSYDGGNDIDDQNAYIMAILSLLEKVKMDDITYSME